MQRSSGKHAAQGSPADAASSHAHSTTMNPNLNSFEVDNWRSVSQKAGESSRASGGLKIPKKYALRGLPPTGSRGLTISGPHAPSKSPATISFASGSGSLSRNNSPKFSRLLQQTLGSSLSFNNPTAMSSGSGGPNYPSPREELMVDGTFTSVPRSQTVTRPPSPVLSVDYSIISPPSPTATLIDYQDITFDGEVFKTPNGGNQVPSCTFFVTPPGARCSPSPTRRGLTKRGTKNGKGLLPRLLGALSSPSKKGKGKVLPEYDYFDGLPLDGEEGELIDEACYIDISPSTGIDILSLLPTEIGLYICLFLDISSVLSCLQVNRRWNFLVSDPIVWRELFYRQPGWNINTRRINQLRRIASAGSSKSKRKAGTYAQSAAQFVGNSNGNGPLRLSSDLTFSLSSLSLRSTSVISRDIQPPSSPVSVRGFNIFDSSMAPLSLNWNELYKTRLELDHRWTSGEPRTMQITGHQDSVYCLEFDSHKIITGSRDKTIKIWSLHTGKLLATLRGHSGSVLCLKFDESGFMVSGSSDKTIFVWNLSKLGLPSMLRSGGAGNARSDGGLVFDSGEGDHELVQSILRGHTGGVLDLRIDKKWIISCSKDTFIRIWKRSSLTLFTTLQGHEGPVNAVGLQDDKVVSASGDGKMMLWDIASGQRIRTFEGHDRGLACIEFQNDLIVSGSNDYKIKLWSASTGECLKTLVGHESLVRALSFDPRSMRLVSASYDKTVKVWDLKEGKLVREFKDSHMSQIFDVKFDTCRIVSTSHDQKVVVLDFSHGLDTSLFA